MRRRTLLSVCAAGLAAGAGCLTEGAEPANSSSDPRASGDGAPEPSTGRPSDRSPAENYPETTMPRPEEWSLTAEPGTCGSGQYAQIALSDSTLIVNGRLGTPNPCYGAQLATTDRNDGTVRVRVAPVTPSPGAGCVQCLGEVPYRARGPVQVEGLDRVVVQHGDGDGWTTVATLDV